MQSLLRVGRRHSKVTLWALAFFGLLALPLILPVEVSAANCSLNNMSIQTGAECARGTGQPSTLFGGEGSIFTRVTNILLFLVGAIAVIMLIFGGIRYIVSGGDQTQVTAAKNTILYAIIGIVIALLAYAAVQFVVTVLLGNIS